MAIHNGRWKRGRTVAVAATVAAVLIGITGCSGNSGDSEKSADGKTTITWWDYYTDDSTVGGLNTLFKQYESEHPDITIKRRSIAYDNLKQTMLQSAGAGASALPDVAVVNSPDNQQFAQLGIAADITSKLKATGDLDKYVKGSIQSATYKGGIYGLPITVNDLGLFYNKDIFSKAGLTPPTTWDELKADAKQLTASGRYGLAYAAPDSQQATFMWLPTLWQAGGDLTDLTSPEAENALSFWASLMSDGSVSKEALNWDETTGVGPEFEQARAAMMINGPWMVPNLKKDVPNLNWGVAPLPAGKTQASALGGENYMVIKGKNEAAAWDLVKWLQDPTRLKQLDDATGSLPTRSDVAASSADPSYAVFASVLPYARPRAYGANYPQIADQVTTAIQSVLTGSSNPSNALKKAATAVKPLLPKN